MVRYNHETLLLEGIKQLEKKGFRVIRLDRRIIPDAIAIYGKKVIAIESDTNPTSVWLTTRRFNKGSQYDEEIIITNPHENHYHSPTTYYRVLELHNSGNESIRGIIKIVKKEFNLKTLSVSTVHDWIKGRKIPLTLLRETINKKYI